MDTLAAPSLHVSTLGVTAAFVDGRRIPLTRAERTLIAALVAHPHTGASVSRLLSLLWPDGPPVTARQSLCNHVSRLRAKLPGVEVVRRGDRYRLTPTPSTDIDQLTIALMEAQRALDLGKPAAAVELLPPPGDPTRRHLADLDGDPVATGIAYAANERRVDASQLRAQALLAAGRPAQAVAELEQLVAAHPGREPVWALLLTATAATGRRMDAIGVYRRAHRTLTTGFGLDPGPQLQRLHADLLRHDDATLQSSNRFVGRTRAIMRCRDGLTAVGSALVVGGPGTGKTALVREVAAGWPGVTAFVACAENRWHALSPVVALLDALPGDPDEALAASPTTVDTLLHRLRRAVDGGDPLLVVLDDVDRLGPFSAMLLDQVLSRPHIRVLAASRTPDVDLPGRGADGILVELAGLSAAAIAALLDDEDLAVADEVVRLTGGVPAHVHALLGALRTERLPPAALVGDPPLTLTAPLREAVLRIVAALPRATQLALEALSVADEPATLAQLSAVAPVEALDVALRAGVLVLGAEGRLSFSSPLLRRVVYEQVPAGRRSELHCTLWASGPTSNHVRHAEVLNRSLRDAVGDLPGRA